MGLGEIVNVGCETGTIVMIGKRRRMSETTSSLSRVPVIESKRIRLNSVITKHSLSLCCPTGVGVSHGGEWLLPKILERRLCTDGIGNDFRDK